MAGGIQRQADTVDAILEREKVLGDQRRLMADVAIQNDPGNQVDAIVGSHERGRPQSGWKRLVEKLRSWFLK